MLTLIEKTWQSRNDFDGVYECSKCHKHQHIKSCYHDDNYFLNVIPTFKCAWCEDGSFQKIELKEKVIQDWAVV